VISAATRHDSLPRLAVLAVITVLTVVVVSGCLPSAPAPPPPAPQAVQWLVYGDSLSEEAAPYLSHYGSVGQRYFGGTAPCDWTGHLNNDATSWTPTAVLLQFSGNLFTPCTQGRDPTASYTQDLTTLANFWKTRGKPVTIVISPPKPDDSEAWARNAELGVAAKLGLSTNRADQAVLNSGSFTYSLPCLTPTEDGCGAEQPGMERVRDPDGIHFGLSAPNGYSSGAYRYASLEAAVVYANVEAPAH
jgi:hypothetical protein